MRRLRKRLGFFLSLAALACAGSRAFSYTGPNCRDRTDNALPQGAYHLPASQASQLQTALDQHKVVVLDPGGDYRSFPSTVTISSNYELYSVGRNTLLPPIKVMGGTSGAVLSGLAPTQIIFGAGLISDSCFERITTDHFSGNVSLSTATFENNLFLDFTQNGSLSIDTHNGGSLRDNRFIRYVGHGGMLTVQGDVGKSSQNNVMLFLNLLTPIGDGIVMDSQDSFNFVGMDVESWNYFGDKIHNAMMTVTNTRALRMFFAHGGDAKVPPDPYSDIDATELEVIGMEFVGPVALPANSVQPSNQRAAFITSIDSNVVNNASPNNFYMNALENKTSTVAINGLTVSSAGAITAASAAAFNEMFISPPAPVTPWPAPILPSIPDPAGPNWNVNLSGQVDSAPLIQNLINTTGIAQLAAGIYYVSTPIQLKNGQALVGAGANQTALVAMNSSIDLVVGADHISSGNGYTSSSTEGFAVADITLEGGANGIHLDPNGSGDWAQFTFGYFSHITMRNIANAGVYVDAIYGLDNNFFDNLNCYNCYAGVMQHVSPTYPGGDAPGMAYMDKNVYYRSQFVNGTYGGSWPANRGDNLNMYVDSLFENNTAGSLITNDADATIIANSDLINNGGNPSWLSNAPYGCVNCRFTGGPQGVVLMGTNGFCEGCTFNSGGGSAKIVAAGSKNTLTNCKSVDMPLGSLNQGMLINTLLPLDAAFNQKAVYVNNGFPSTLIAGTPQPAPQFLVATGTPPISSTAAAAGLRYAYAYPNPSIQTTPTIRIGMGVLTRATITIFNSAGRVVSGESISLGTPNGFFNGAYYYDYVWGGRHASGVYYAVIHGFGTTGTIVKARVKFAVVN